MRGRKRRSKHETHMFDLVVPQTKYSKVNSGIFIEECLSKVLKKFGGKAVLEGDDIQVTSPQLRNQINDDFYHVGKRRIPEWIFKQPDANIAAVLCGIHTAIGYRRETSVAFYHNRWWVLEQIDRLFKTLGVWGTISRKKKEKGWYYILPKKYNKWFNDVIGVINPLKAIHSTNSIHKSNYRECGVTDITKLPNATRSVYDIEVEGTHRFFANDILVHNTDSVYIVDPYHDRERVERVCETISEAQRLDMNVYIPTHSLEVEDYIHHMYFFRNNKGEFVKKFYAYVVDDKKKGGLKVKLKGVALVRGSTSQLAKAVYKKYIEQDLINFEVGQYEPEQVYEWVAELFAEDPDQLSKRFRPKKPSSYKATKGKSEPTSIYYSIAKVYGEGEFWMVPNAALGIGKTKRYALKEELVAEFGDSWIDQVLLYPIVEELQVFIPWESRKRIKKLQVKPDPRYFVWDEPHLSFKTTNVLEIKSFRESKSHREVDRKMWMKLRKKGYKAENGK
jgi:hypothetical protein